MTSVANPFTLPFPAFMLPASIGNTFCERGERRPGNESMCLPLLFTARMAEMLQNFLAVIFVVVLLTQRGTLCFPMHWFVLPANSIIALLFSEESYPIASR